MQQLNISEWFDENYQFKGVELLPQGLDEETMWQVLSALPLEDEFIGTNLTQLDVPLLCMRGNITKEVLIESLPNLIEYMIENPDNMEPVMSYIVLMTEEDDEGNSEFTEQERHEFGEQLFMILGEVWRDCTSMDLPPEAIAGTLEVLGDLAVWASVAYMDVLANIHLDDITKLHPDMHTLYMMANVHFNLNDIQWDNVSIDEIENIIRDYGVVLLTPANDTAMLLRVSKFIALASLHYDQLTA